MTAKPDSTLLEILQLLSELTVFESYDFQEFLKKLLKLINKLIPTDSLLIYIYNRTTKELILVGSKHPKKNLLGKITMHRGEGITGWVVDHKQSVAIGKQAYKDKRFKLFKELPEDKYEAFLSVPIIDKQGVVGVLNLQHKTPLSFAKAEIKLMEGIGKIIASAFEKVLLAEKVSSLEEKIAERKLVEKAKGVLMDTKKISEDQAYKILRSEAMKKRKKLKDIAEAVILVFGNIT